ncbi:exonuclease domain-containing protein [Peribacillus huizhouensis]|uniref:DNA polymerase-3 subunit epsilon n=1 Tax=Peribacillus huizhouensis TaxID=1501239 RepID=A0ABR6CTC1_9BACI|nr:exonuclease domain-containing protein [Peribacillus huizhouensis]MBA9028194.1 DNA polymerase-3 subunit epsilon [Peribacillus huizhouensis]
MSIQKKVGLVLDVETTGLSPNEDEMIELAMKLFSFNELTGEVLEVIDEDTFLREPMSTSARRNYDHAYEVHGIPFELVRGKSFYDVKIKTYFNHANAVFAHNASFDRSFLVRMYPDVNELKWYCTMRGVAWKDYGMYNSKLLTLLKHHSISDFQSHRAMDDITYLLELIKKQNPYGDLYLQEILKRGPMRKYKPAAKQVKRKSAFNI